MKSIGIFGDSFAGADESYSGMQYHWSTLLKNYFNCELVNYGLGGSSVYYSYKQFLHNHKKHDCVIFLVTEPGRYIKPVITKTQQKIFVPNIASIDHIDQTYSITEPMVSDLQGWFLASDDTFNIDMSELMLEKILSLQPQTIVIPCFDSSVQNLNLDFNLFELQEKQASLFGLTAYELLSNYVENYDIISGHFLPEINHIVYENIKNRINNKKWNWTVNKVTTKYKLEEAYRRNK